MDFDASGHLSLSETLVVSKSTENSHIEFGRICQICDKSFSISHINDSRVICPDCKEKLKILLESVK